MEVFKLSNHNKHLLHYFSIDLHAVIVLVKIFHLSESKDKSQRPEINNYCSFLAKTSFIEISKSLTEMGTIVETIIVTATENSMM